jgi:transcriptional regulator with XRE-family HTH domain
VPPNPEISAELARFGANVRRERMALEMTQERLAEMADLNIRTVQKIEAGRMNVLITTATRIQEALRCRWDDLLPRGILNRPR